MTTQTWKTATTGEWLTPADWTSAVPGTLDAAIINSGESVTVSGTDTTAVASSLLLNGGALTVSGTLTLGTSFTIENSGQVTMSGGTLAAASITAGAGGGNNDFIGFGTLQGKMTGGMAVYASGGTLTVQGGDLAGFTGNFGVESAGSTLEINQANLLAGDTAPNFGVGIIGGTLKLDNPTAFQSTGTVYYNSTAGTIDLAGIIASSATYSGSTLTINETNLQHLTLSVSGSFGSDTLQVVSDGSGGTDISWAAPTAPTVTESLVSDTGSSSTDKIT